MIIGKNLPTIKDNVSAKNAHVSKAQSSVQVSKPSINAAQSIPRTAASLISSAGLPADKLSSSIVSFMRFFSLPLKPQLMTEIRQQVFSQQANSTANQADLSASLTQAKFLDTAKGREALALTAAACESKGVELTPKGLETYVDAVDPDSRQNEQGRRQNKEKNDKREIESITADNIKEKIFEYLKENPIIDILNKLPGKDGQQWIVLPFDFTDDGRVFKVSMRILIDKDKEQALCMALDITSCDEQAIDNTGNRWVFVMEVANEKPVRVSIYLHSKIQQELYPQFKEEISRLLEIPIERVFLKQCDESFPYESCLYDEPLPSIDEEV
ncbi:MAG: hypothetical protein FWD47_10315 [Treponema sp.]|nr:hypothetical protein [Treponema sp.]